MSRTPPEDHITFALSCQRHTHNNKVDFDAVAKECNMTSKGAAAKRFERLNKAFPPPNSTGTSSTPVTPGTAAIPKQKWKDVTDKSAAGKKRKIDRKSEDPFTMDGLPYDPVADANRLQKYLGGLTPARAEGENACPLVQPLNTTYDSLPLPGRHAPSGTGFQPTSFGPAMPAEYAADRAPHGPGLPPPRYAPPMRAEDAADRAAHGTGLPPTSYRPAMPAEYAEDRAADRAAQGTGLPPTSYDAPMPWRHAADDAYVKLRAFLRRRSLSNPYDPTALPDGLPRAAYSNARNNYRLYQYAMSAGQSPQAFGRAANMGVQDANLMDWVDEPLRNIPPPGPQSPQVFDRSLIDPRLLNWVPPQQSRPLPQEVERGPAATEEGENEGR